MSINHSNGACFSKTNVNYLNKEHPEDVLQDFKFYRTAIKDFAGRQYKGLGSDTKKPGSDTRLPGWYVFVVQTICQSSVRG